MAKVRVYELAKELGVESKVVMTKLQELGEFVTAGRMPSRTTVPNGSGSDADEHPMSTQL